MKRTQIGGQSVGATAHVFRWHAVNFAAIAGGKHQGLFQDPARSQFRRSLLRPFARKGHPLPHLDWRGPVIQSYENDFHDFANAPLEVPVRMREKEIHSCKTENHEREIEDAEFRSS